MTLLRLGSNSYRSIWKKSLVRTVVPSCRKRTNIRIYSSSVKDGNEVTSSKPLGRRIQVWQVPAQKSPNSSADITIYQSKLSPIDHHDTKNSWQKVDPPPKPSSEPKPKSLLDLDKLRSLSNQLISHFLPHNYPHSVHSSYKNYTLYSFIGNTAGSTTMALSTQSLLLALGLCSSSTASTTLLAGTLNWILKDGIGQLGGIYVASKVSSLRELDVNPKRWRMMSAFAFDGAIWLECLSPMFPGYFLVVASVANLGKNVSFLTASASRATLHQALCRNQNNLGDVTAKAGSQSIAASLLGTGIGIVLTPLLNVGGGTDSCMGVLGTCMALGMIHQWSTYQSLRVVPLTSLNRHRLHILVTSWLERYHHGEDDASRQVDLDPEFVAQKECFIPIHHPDDSHTWFDTGCSVPGFAPQGATELHVLMEKCLSGNERYVVNCDIRSIEEITPTNSSGEIKKVTVKLLFMENANDVDVLRGFFHAYAIHAMCNGSISVPVEREDDGTLSKDQLLIAESHVYVQDHVDAFIVDMKKYGWDTDNNSVVIDTNLCNRIRVEALK